MRVGITGHQQLQDPEAWPWAEEIVGRGPVRMRMHIWRPAGVLWSCRM